MSFIDRPTGFRDLAALAARMKHRITLEKPVYQSDSAGGATVDWQEVATVWADVQTRRSRAGESLESGKIEATSSPRFIIRFRDDITPAMRIGFKGKSYNIRQVNPVDHAGIALEITTEQGVAT